MKRFWLDDLGLKLAALLLAFALWLYVGTNQVLERRVDLKVVFTDLPANASLSNEVQSMVPVVLVGRKERVGSLETRDIKAVVSLQGVPVPVRDYPVKIQVSNVPKGVALDVPPFLVTLTGVKPTVTPTPTKKIPRVSNRKH
jgi:YbbR domain-containing protein